jgi:hypothetical protein
MFRLDFSLSGEHTDDKAMRPNPGKRPKGVDLEAPSRTVHQVGTYGHTVWSECKEESQQMI